MQNRNKIEAIDDDQLLQIAKALDTFDGNNISGFLKRLASIPSAPMDVINLFLVDILVQNLKVDVNIRDNYEEINRLRTRLAVRKNNVYFKHYTNFRVRLNRVMDEMKGKNNANMVLTNSIDHNFNSTDHDLSSTMTTGLDSYNNVIKPLSIPVVSEPQLIKSQGNYSNASSIINIEKLIAENLRLKQSMEELTQKNSEQRGFISLMMQKNAAEQNEVATNSKKRIEELERMLVKKHAEHQNFLKDNAMKHEKQLGELADAIAKRDEEHNNYVREHEKHLIELKQEIAKKDEIIAKQEIQQKLTENRINRYETTEVFADDNDNEEAIEYIENFESNFDKMMRSTKKEIKQIISKSKLKTTSDSATNIRNAFQLAILDRDIKQQLADEAYEVYKSFHRKVAMRSQANLPEINSSDKVIQIEFDKVIVDETQLNKNNQASLPAASHYIALITKIIKLNPALSNEQLNSVSKIVTDWQNPHNENKMIDLQKKDIKLDEVVNFSKQILPPRQFTNIDKFHDIIITLQSGKAYRAILDEALNIYRVSQNVDEQYIAALIIMQLNDKVCNQLIKFQPINQSAELSEQTMFQEELQLMHDQVVAKDKIEIEGIEIKSIDLHHQSNDSSKLKQAHIAANIFCQVLTKEQQENFSKLLVESIDALESEINNRSKKKKTVAKLSNQSMFNNNNSNNESTNQNKRKVNTPESNRAKTSNRAKKSKY